MGTTLHCYVEESASDGAVWGVLGTWDFGKDYPLAFYLHEHSVRGWPEDSWAAKIDNIHDYDRMWCDVQTLAEAIDTLKVRDYEPDPHDPPEPPVPAYTGHAEALLASLRVLEAKRVTLRILWWRSP